MLEGLNLSNLNVDDSGRVSFSGLSSGIDLQGTVDAIIGARRIPVDRLEATVESNTEKIASLQDLRTILETLRSSLSNLYGQISFGNNNDIFAVKQAFASSARVDGTTASAAGNLMGVTVDNSASIGNHSVEILQTAKSHKISSDQITNPSAALGFSSTDEFTITSDKTRTSFQSAISSAGTDPIGSAGTLSFTDDNGDVIGTVAYLATDTLDDLAAAITANVTDVDAEVEVVSGGVRLRVTGSDAFRMTETAAGTALTDFELGVRKFPLSSATTLLEIRDLINQANKGSNATGVSASVVTVTASESYLVLTATDTGVTMTLADTGGTPLETLGLLYDPNVGGNQFQYSEQAGNAYWTSPDSTINTDVITAPDGSLTADALVGSAVDTWHYISTAAQEAVTNTTAYTYSTYVKAGDKSDVRLQVNGAGFGGAHRAHFDLATGLLKSTVGSVDATSITDEGNGWYRISMTVTATADGSADFERYVEDPASTTYAGDGTTENAYFWGAQMEAAAAPGAYVPTSTGIEAKNELQAARNALLYADGILDQTNLSYESDYQTGSTVQIGSNGTLSFNAGALGTVAYTSGMTLSQLATDITANITGVTATIVTDGLGVRLQIDGTSAFVMTETGGGTAITDLGIDKSRKVIERASNTIDDLFTGVTLSLFAAEAGTTISLDVEQDLSQVKTEVLNFVETYNALRQFANANKLANNATGEIAEEAGVLSKSTALAGVVSTLSQIIGGNVAGVDPNYTVLSQIGVNFVELNQEDPLLAENLEVDEALLDNVLLSNADDVRKLFSFDFTASDPRITLLNFDKNTQYNSSGYTLNLQPVSGDNQLQYSEQADNAYWTTPDSTINADVTTAPDGTLSADALVGSVVDTWHYISTTAQENVTAGTNYIYSTYVKAGNRDDIRLQVNGAGFSGAHAAYFNLGTGTLTSANAAVDATSIEDVGDGWYRISMTIDATANAGAQLERYVQDPASTTYAGDGSTPDAYFWGAQLEEVTTETSPSPYVPTTNAAVVGGLPSANIDGAADGTDDGSATIAGNVITVNTGDAEGLQLFFSGLDLRQAIQLDMTVGIGAQMFFKLTDLLDTTTGLVDGEIDELTDQNTVHNERITEMMDRLEIQRQNLLERYIAMETALASANRIMESIRQTTDSLSSNS